MNQNNHLSALINSAIGTFNQRSMGKLTLDPVDFNADAILKVEDKKPRYRPGHKQMYINIQYIYMYTNAVYSPKNP